MGERIDSSHPPLLEDPHGPCLDGLLRGAWARLLDLLLVARELGIELLDLLIDGVAALGDSVGCVLDGGRGFLVLLGAEDLLHRIRRNPKGARGESKEGGVRGIAIAGRRGIGVDARKGTLKSIEGGEISAFL